MDLEARRSTALAAAERAAQLAMKHFASIDSLTIEKKGHQDLVSNADRDVEKLIRKLLLESYPDDGIVGEEFDNKPSDSGFSWVIDPIDGTASFVRGRPGWCVVIAGVYNGSTVVGVVHDAVADEVFDAIKDGGARRNGKPIAPSVSESFADGAVGIGFNSRFPPQMALQLMQHLLVEQQGVFYQNGSGALMLAYVACGRLIGFAEPHMHAWDCMASLLIIEEAGGKVQSFDQLNMIANGGRVVVACTGVFDQLTLLTDDIFGDFSWCP